MYTVSSQLSIRRRVYEAWKTIIDSMAFVKVGGCKGAITQIWTESNFMTEYICLDFAILTYSFPNIFPPLKNNYCKNQIMKDQNKTQMK